jgi:hypothetical protein
MALEKELAVFQQRLPEFTADRVGQWVLIHGDEVADFFTSYDDAIKAGYTKFGLDPFLVRQIQALEQVHFVTRSIEPAS